MMQTRCPACVTVFRVTPEQLKARHGKVRCGQCQHVFDALDSLIDASREESVVEQPVVRPELSSPEPVIKEEAAWPRTLPNLPDEPIEEPAQTLAIDQETIVFVALDEPLTPAEPAQAATELAPETSAEPSPEFAPEPASAEAPEPILVPSAPEAKSPKRIEPIKQSKRIEPLLHEDHEDHEDHEEAPSGHAWLWAFACLLVLAALLVQTLVQFRVELAVLAPEIKPTLQAACSLLDCDLPLPRKADQLSIEASDLHPDPQNKGQLTLSATLKNRAPFHQTYPHLELTLTDTADQPLLRKIIAPIEYLPKGSDMTSGFVANGEIAINLALIPENAAKAAAAGYRLYLFYP